MIIDSLKWKNDILINAHKLRKINSKKITEKSFFELEKYFFNTAYAIRKLYQSEKISDSLFKKDIVLFYLTPLKHINKRTWWNIHEVYDLKKLIKCSIKLDFLLNQIIHSYTFMPIFDDKYKAINLILFHSDKERNSKTYAISLHSYIKILEEVSSNYPSSLKRVYDDKIDDYITEVGN